VVLPVAASDTVAPDLLVLPMHYGSLWLPSSAGVNLLTIAAVDPLSKQPELKHAAARLVRGDPGFPWHGALLVRVAADRVGAALEHLRTLAALAAFGSVALFARDTASPGVLLQLAHPRSLSSDLHALAAQLGMAADAPRLADVRAGRVRALQFADGRVSIALLEGRQRADLAARSVYRRLIADAIDCSQHSMRELFAPVP
jgi:assimilatory nitrate reductase catalytic subunit